ncbi:MAG TPA: FAD-dependent thymidylate synthase [Actinomycetes bacterium]|nr:FAD-dependent thymidylate synthase [Actinomycetes bacterium]
MPASGQPRYWVEAFDDEERRRLAPYFTNADRPVFALRNLPEVVKGALFARYSRSGKTLRRLFLDEFHDRVAGEAPPLTPSVGEARASALYQRVLDEYGDDSVAQLAGAHVACEQASNLLTKTLEWGRLAAYMEQSTRYVSYTDQPGGRWRYHVDPSVDADPEAGPEYRRVLDGVFATYAELVPALTEWLGRVLVPEAGASEAAWRRAVKARALDALRGLLPAATTSNLGIFASGQAYEALLLRLRANPLPEARGYGDLLLAELRQVIPNFLTRVDREDRGVAWSRYLAGTAEDTAKVADALLGDPAPAQEGPSVRLVESDPAAEDKVLTAIAYPLLRIGEAEVAARVARLGAEDRSRLLNAYVGERGNRRHRPGRAFERAVYTFDVVCDYGAFRDLQRHRLCTIVWQRLTPDLGYDLPEDVASAALGERYGARMRELAALYRALEPRYPAQAPYAVSMAHRMRFAVTLNARELMHLVELRSTPQGHPTYRTVAQQMHRLVAEQAGHRGLAEAMRFVVHDDVDLGRLAAEQRSQARLHGGLPA